MFRRGRRIAHCVGAALSALLVCAAGARGQDASEALEEYLSERGLVRLLATHLEARLEEAASVEKVEIAERLAGVYARMLEDAGTVERQREIEKRSEALLRAVPGADSLVLRLGLARSAFLRAERDVQRWRVRMLEGIDGGDLMMRLDRIEEALNDVARRAHEQVKLLERQEETGRVEDRALLGEALAKSRGYRSEAHYFAGWASLYLAEMRGERGIDAGAEAAEHFGWLLNAKTGGRPEIERVPAQTLPLEHVARAALGVAMSYAIRGSAELADAWLELVAGAEGLAPGVESEIARFRMMILVHTGRWEELAALVGSLRAAGEGDAIGLEPMDARYLAVHALEAEPLRSEEDAVEWIRRAAVMDLVSRNELAHVLEVASRYETRTLNRDPFLASLTAGLRSFDEGRRMQEEAGEAEDAPSEREAARSAFARASAALREALASAGSLPEGTLATVRLLRGLSMFYSGGDGERMSAAADELLEASAMLEASDENRAAEAMVMAHKALGIAAEGEWAGAEAAAARRAELEEAFMRRFPDHAFSSLIVVRRSQREGVEPEQAVRDLMRVPRDSRLHETARRQAARLLYELYEEAAASRKQWAANRYAEVAEPLLSLDRQRAAQGDGEAAKRVVVRARRLIEVYLNSPTPDVPRAELALDALAYVARSGAGGARLGAEVMYRRAQLALAKGDIARARGILAELAETDSEMASAGRVLLYKHAARRFRAAQERGSGEVEWASLVVEFGRPLVREFGEESDALSDPGVASLFSTVARAASVLWREREDESARELGLAILRVLLNEHPTDRAFLESAAELAESSGDLESALRYRRMIAAGLEPGTEGWFAARARLIGLLAQVDGERALRVLEQHVVMYPEYGPEPWGGELRRLHESLGGGGGD